MDEQIEFNPKRHLCPDGTCTGIIGSDGRCGECERTAGGSSATAATPSGAGESDFGMTVDDSVGPALATSSDGMAAPGGESVFGGASSTFDPNRRLCDDGSCVGVIGPAGTCTVCGRRAS